MLPAKCSDLGNLKDVFRSAEASLRGEQNFFDLPAAFASVVVLVDGLGELNLTHNADTAPYMNSLATGKSTYSGFPSTTVCSITSLATGLSPSEHGLFGYRIFNRSTNEGVNLLSGLDRWQILDYVNAPAICETTSSPVFAVTKPEYENSGFTQATMSAARHLFSDSMSERFAIALEVVKNTPGALVYLYVPELDQCAHRFGCNSSEWLALLSELDIAVKNLDSGLPQNTGAILTADHGVIDIPLNQHIYLDEYAAISNAILHVGGDPRAPYLYLKSSESISAIAAELEGHFSGVIEVFDQQRMVDEHLWKRSLLLEDDLIPDLVLMAKKDVAIFHRDFSKTKSRQMIAHHGSLTEQEVRVPLLLLGNYSSSLLVP